MEFTQCFSNWGQSASAAECALIMHHSNHSACVSALIVSRTVSCHQHSNSLWSDTSLAASSLREVCYSTSSPTRCCLQLLSQLLLLLPQGQQRRPYPILLFFQILLVFQISLGILFGSCLPIPPILVGVWERESNRRAEVKGQVCRGCGKSSAGRSTATFLPETCDVAGTNTRTATNLFSHWNRNWAEISMTGNWC